MTDVKGSTQAIKLGRYKEVNAVAAASIAALLNASVSAELPFVFSGDGAVVLLPPEDFDAAQHALAAAREMAQEQFGLGLRAALISVSDIVAAGHALRIAKLWMGENFQQAIFSGGGISYAEKLLKETDEYEIPSHIQPDGHFDGFACRWNPVRSPHGETISLIVQAQDTATYASVLHEIERIYGNSDNRRPVTTDNLKFVLNPFGFNVESRIRYRTQNVLRLMGLAFSSLMASTFLRFAKRGGTSAPVLATDHEKFDDALRMTIAGTVQQSQTLRDYLELCRISGELEYGLHTADHAVVTCLVFQNGGQEVHLVDAAGGGYAMAAAQMKGESA